MAAVTVTESLRDWSWTRSGKSMPVGWRRHNVHVPSSDVARGLLGERITRQEGRRFRQAMSVSCSKVALVAGLGEISR